VVLIPLHHGIEVGAELENFVELFIPCIKQIIEKRTTKNDNFGVNFNRLGL
jgi:hypothetical protein